MEAGIDTIKVVTRHNAAREKKSTTSKRARRVVCSRCGERMTAGASAGWVIYRTWIVFSDAGETGLSEEAYRCPACEKATAVSGDTPLSAPALPAAR